MTLERKGAQKIVDGLNQAVGYTQGWNEAMERAAMMIASYSPDQIRMATGEMTAQELRSVLAVQRWWAAAVRTLIINGEFAKQEGEPNDRS